MTPADIRAGDADRERVASALASHTGAGRLTLDEFSERVAAVYRASTMGELSVLTRDLPTPAPGETVAAASRPARAVVSAAIAAAVVVLLVGAASVAYAGPLMSAWGFGCA